MIFAFEDCELDTRAIRAALGWRRGARAAAGVRVLAYLVDHHDRAVAKTELLDDVWGDRFMSESTVTSRIKAVRRGRYGKWEERPAALEDVLVEFHPDVV